MKNNTGKNTDNGLLKRIILDPFLRVSITWAMGIVCVVMVLTFVTIQMDTRDERVISIFPFLMVLFGSFYLVKFIGRRPAFYAGLCGFLVGVGLALIGLLGELMNGLYFEPFARFILVSLARGVPLALAGMVGGWWATRGRTPIEIEFPDKDELAAAKKSGSQEPRPRIVTPVAAMPGNKSANAALLAQLEKNPDSLMSEKDKKRLKKKSGAGKTK